MIHISRCIPAVDGTLLEAYSQQSVATVHEAMGRRRALDMGIKPIACGMKVCGRACDARHNVKRGFDIYEWKGIRQR